MIWNTLEMQDEKIEYFPLKNSGTRLLTLNYI